MEVSFDKVSIFTSLCSADVVLVAALRVHGQSHGQSSETVAKQIFSAILNLADGNADNKRLLGEAGAAEGECVSSQ